MPRFITKWQNDHLVIAVVSSCSSHVSDTTETGNIDQHTPRSRGSVPLVPMKVRDKCEH